MPRRPVSSTYRLQLRGPGADPQGRAFTFADVENIVPYLASLGISHLYLSPILTAPPDSPHNYNVTDPTSINPALGGRDGFEHLAHTAHRHGLGIIIDIVPNHVGIDTPRTNAWWWDVLTYGPTSRFNPYFDIDWTPDNGTNGRLGIPVLAHPDDVDLLRIVPVDDTNRPATADGTGPAVTHMLAYYDNLYPIRPGTEFANDGTLDSPHNIHTRQHYQLRYWRDGVIGYRRFFSVNGLAGIRQENPVVFEHTHRVLRELIAADLVDGVRVDHPDGLADPFNYLCRLRTLVGDHRLLLVEKILGHAEPLDPRLDVDGTTGYDALREFDGVFVSRRSEAALGQLAFDYTGSRWDHEELAAAEATAKVDVAHRELGAEVRRLARAIRKDNWSTGGDDVTDEQLVDTLTTIIGEMPVYRADYQSLSRTTATVIQKAASTRPSQIRAIDLIAAGLLSYGEAWVRFAQVCGAVMAKGVEDKTFYRASRLVALQEVGGAPDCFGLSLAEFHLLQAERAGLWPRTMTTLTTHDTKRSEDTRARIIEITEVPGDFADLLRTLDELAPCPNRATGHFLIQNIIGAWSTHGMTPTVTARLHEYATKAMREAAIGTTWVDVDDEFERSIHAWIDLVCTGPAGAAIDMFVHKIAAASRIIGLGRKALQLLAPGIPDVYQGTEFPDHSLVDPDNRQFVDYAARQHALSLVLDNPGWGAHVTAPDGPVVGDVPTVSDSQLRKMAVVAAALAVRRERPYSFVGGHYLPVFAQGPAGRFLVAFGRGARRDDVDVIVAATRHPIGLAAHGGWGETTLTFPCGRWTDRLTGARWESTVPLSDLFATHPYGIFVRDTASVPHETAR